MDKKTETQLWAAFQLQVLLLQIAQALRHRAEGRQESARVMRTAAARLDIGR